jgi:hypothetical protein
MLAADSFDVLAQSTILRENRISRQFFDPKNSLHLASLKNYLQTGKWGSVQFYVEQPCTTVPETVMRKVTHAFVLQSELVNENRA